MITIVIIISPLNLRSLGIFLYLIIIISLLIFPLFFYSLKCLYNDINHLPYPNNFTQQETNFFSYKTNRNYVIKPADKGGAIVIWSSEDYETEALIQLNNPQSYETIQLCPSRGGSRPVHWVSGNPSNFPKK